MIQWAWQRPLADTLPDAVFRCVEVCLVWPVGAQRLAKYRDHYRASGNLLLSGVEARLFTAGDGLCTCRWCLRADAAPKISERQEGELMNPHTLTTVSEKSRSKRIDIVLWIVARLLHQVASYGIRNINTLNNLKVTVGSSAIGTCVDSSEVFRFNRRTIEPAKQW